MKTYKKLFGVAVCVFLFFIFSCDPPEPIASCRIKTFLWENQLYHASYNTAGRLQLLEADTSKIIFYYDEHDKLFRAEIYVAGDPGIKHKFDFTQGPFGITEIDRYDHGDHVATEIVHYASPTNIDYSIRQEFYHDVVTFEITHHLTWHGGNITFIDSRSDEINASYTASEYDKKKNPFLTLASAVGNPLFFPVGPFVFYPVDEYDIPYVSRFSKNNVQSGYYEIPGTGLDPEVQFYNYHFTGNLVTKIHWSNINYGAITTADYAFEYECH